MTMSVEEARKQLSSFTHYPEKDWPEIIRSGIDGYVKGTHQMRALMMVILYNDERPLAAVIKELENMDGLPVDNDE